MVSANTVGSSPTRSRIEYLDGLRALAALYVVFTHMAGEVWSAQNHHEPVGVFAAATKWVVSYAVYTLLKWIGLILPDGSSAIVPQYVALFALGMLGATIAYSPGCFWKRLRDRLPWTLLAACAFAAFAYDHTHYTLPDYGVLDGLLGIGILGVLVGASRTGHNVVRTALSWKPLVAVGTMSYSLYLMHAPLLQVVWLYGLRPMRLSDGATFICLVVAGTPLIVLGTYLFHLVCERPFMTSARGASGHRQELQPVTEGGRATLIPDWTQLVRRLLLLR